MVTPGVWVLYPGVRMIGGTEAAFSAFFRDAEPRLRRALVAAYGGERGREATSEALSWAWEHWAEVEAMENPVGYLYRVGQSRTRERATPPHFEPAPASLEEVLGDLPASDLTPGRRRPPLPLVYHDIRVWPAEENDQSQDVIDDNRAWFRDPADADRTGITPDHVQVTVRRSLPLDLVDIARMGNPTGNLADGTPVYGDHFESEDPWLTWLADERHYRLRAHDVDAEALRTIANSLA